jgi:hypothetical protein
MLYENYSHPNWLHRQAAAAACVYPAAYLTQIDPQPLCVLLDDPEPRVQGLALVSVKLSFLSGDVNSKIYRTLAKSYLESCSWHISILKHRALRVLLSGIIESEPLGTLILGVIEYLAIRNVPFPLLFPWSAIGVIVYEDSDLLQSTTDKFAFGVVGVFQEFED